MMLKFGPNFVNLAEINTGLLKLQRVVTLIEGILFPPEDQIPADCQFRQSLSVRQETYYEFLVHYSECYKIAQQRGFQCVPCVWA